VRYLLDASALLPLMTKFGRQLIAEASKQEIATTDLAVYEACNSLWKLSTLLKVISLEDAVETATLLRDLIGRTVIQAKPFYMLRLAETLKLANEEELTFYDASYILAAKDLKAMLVTEDEELRQSACKHIQALSFAELERSLCKFSKI